MLEGTATFWDHNPLVEALAYSGSYHLSGFMRTFVASEI